MDHLGDAQRLILLGRQFWPRGISATFPRRIPKLLRGNYMVGCLLLKKLEAGSKKPKLELSERGQNPPLLPDPQTSEDRLAEALERQEMAQ